MTGPYNGAPFGLSIAVPAVAGPVQPRHGRDPRGDQHQPEHRPGDGGRRRCRRSSRAFRSACARSTSRSTSRASSTTRPTARQPAGDGNDADLDVRGDAVRPQQPLPGRRMRQPGFKPSFAATTTGEDLESQRCEPGDDDHPGRGPGEHQVRQGAAAEAAALALTTLQKACLANDVRRRPVALPQSRSGSEVGTAAVDTPTLPGVMSGPAFLVSHGGAAFPDLELVLEGDGVKIDPGRQHEHQKRRHDDDVRDQRRTCRSRASRQPAAGPAHCAGGGTAHHEPLHQPAGDADDDHRRRTAR